MYAIRFQESSTSAADSSELDGDNPLQNANVMSSNQGMKASGLHSLYLLCYVPDSSHSSFHRLKEFLKELPKPFGKHPRYSRKILPVLTASNAGTRSR